MIMIGMTGKKRSGKDTVASMISETYDGFERVAFAGPLKGMIRSLLLSTGMSEAEVEERINGSEEMKEEPLAVLQGKSARFAMQTIGTEWRDFFGKNLWTDIITAKIGEIEKRGDNAIMTDMRFLHEAAFIDSLGGVKVRVKRAGQSSGDTHPSEVEMEKIIPDITIYNYGCLEGLRLAVETLVFCVTTTTSIADIDISA